MKKSIKRLHGFWSKTLCRQTFVLRNVWSTQLWARHLVNTCLHAAPVDQMSVSLMFFDRRSWSQQNKFQDWSFFDQTEAGLLNIQLRPLMVSLAFFAFRFFVLLTIWPFGHLAFWAFSLLGFQPFVLSAFFAFSLLGFQPFGLSAFWAFSILGFQPFGLSAFWAFSLLGFQPFGLSAFWLFWLLAFWPFDLFTYWLIGWLVFAFLVLAFCFLGASWAFLTFWAFGLSWCCWPFWPFLQKID